MVQFPMITLQSGSSDCQEKQPAYLRLQIVKIIISSVLHIFISLDILNLWFRSQRTEMKCNASTLGARIGKHVAIKW